VAIFSGATNLGRPAALRYSDAFETVLEIVAPPAPSSANLNLKIVPLFDWSKSVALSLLVESESDPAVLSFWPRAGPVGTVFTVSVIIDKYPIRPPGSYDSNYANVAGPVNPRVLVQLFEDGLLVNRSAGVQLLSSEVTLHPTPDT